MTQNSETPSLKHILLNGMMFNISWLLIVSQQSTALALCVVVAHLGLHFAIMGKGLPEVRLVVMVSVFGVFLDQVLFATGVFTIAGNVSLAPIWLTCLWPALATTLMHAFSGLQGRNVLAMIAGGIGGTTSYVAGVRMTDIDFGSPLWAPLAICVLWAMLFPTLLTLAEREITVLKRTPYAWT